MTRTLLRAGALSCALLTTTALTAPALAQTSDIPPPVRYAVDENGIDLARGEHILNFTDVGIGPVDGGLAYTRQLRLGAASNNFDMGLFREGNRWTATVGLEAFAFDQSVPFNFTSADGKGAILAYNNGAYELTLADGTVVRFGYIIRATDDVNRLSRATRITAPNGDQTDLHWVSENWCTTTSPDCLDWRVSVRLQAVTNTYGYQLHLNYGRADIRYLDDAASWNRLDSITAINMTALVAGESCLAQAHACTLTQAWPTASYSGNEVTDPTDRTTSYTSSGNTLRIRHPGSTSDDMVYTYGTDGKIDTVTRDGQTWSYLFATSAGHPDPADNYVRVYIDDPNGNRLRVVSDLTLKLPEEVTEQFSLQTDTDDITTRYEYDPATGLLERAVAPEGNAVEHDYDARGNVTTTRFVPQAGSGEATITTSATYDACDATNLRWCNRPRTTTDGRGYVTNYDYSADHGGVTRVRLPAPATGAIRPETRYTYGSFTTAGGQTVWRLTGTSACQNLADCTTTASPDEARTVIEYDDPNLQVSRVTQRNGTNTLSAATSYTYNRNGQVLFVDGPLAGTTDQVRMIYNAGGELVGRISPDPDGSGTGNPLKHRAERYTYNPRGLLQRIEAGTVASQSAADWDGFVRLARVDLTYDGADRLKRRALWTAEVGSGADIRALEQMSYDAGGRLQCTAVRMNPYQFGAPPDDACTLDTPGTGANDFGPDRITRFSYDRGDRLTLVQTGYGTAEVANEAAYTYNPNGTVARVTDAEANRTAFIYDGHDRLRQFKYPDPDTPNTYSPDDYDQYGYDANGNVTSFRNRSNHTADFVYDRLNRLTLHDRYNTTSDISYTYDLFGRMRSATQGANVIGFEYDALGRPTREQGTLAGGTFAYDLTSQYDAAGRRTQLDYSPGGFFLAYDYLATGEMTKVRVNGATGGVNVAATYAYDDLGRRTSLTRGNGVVTSYGYDDVSRLASIAFDAADTTNDLTLTFAHNPAGQIVSRTASDTSYAFTGHASGSVTDTHNGLNQIVTTGGVALQHNQRGSIKAIGSTDYVYTEENRLSSVEGGVAAGGVSLSYDPLGRLYQVAGPSGTRRFVHDGGEVIGEYDALGTYLHRYIHGAGTDELVAWDDRTDPADIERFYAHADERGSVIGYSDYADRMEMLNRYDEYGRPQAGALNGRFGYTGQAWLPEIGMYHYRARIYNPDLGRFMQADPIGYEGGMNLYAYVGNDPINLTDPLGLDKGGKEEFVGKIKWVDKGWGKSFGNPGFGLQKEVRNVTISKDPKTGLSKTTYGPWVPVTDFEGGGFFGTGGPMVALSGIGEVADRVGSRRTLICRGPARILEGNSNFIGRTGAFGVPVSDHSAAIIPLQFTGQARVGPVLRSIGEKAFGFTDRGQWFIGLTDAIAHASLGTARQVQQRHMGNNPGRLIVEIVGGQDTTDMINLFVAQTQFGCPDNTSQIGSF